MSKDNPPKKRRLLSIIFSIFKFTVAMILTFIISFTVTLAVKTNEPADYVGSFVERIFPEEEIVRAANVPEIKTIFDEQNSRAFDPKKYPDKLADKKSAVSEVVEENSSADAGQSARVEDIPINEPQPPPTPQRTEELGLLDTLSRMSSIKPAVDNKIKNIPHYVTINEVPYILCQAVVSVEDTRFYKHKGFDIFGIARAVLVNVEAGEIQEGASTITQQTVKNLFLTSDQTFTRKAEELILSMNMEDEFKKDKILEIYLNVIYFGSNFYGIYDAAQGYFGKEPADLTVAECAMLAGLPNAPSLYSPYVDFHLAKKRQLVVIDAMEKAGVISKREAENARIEEIILAH